jgi:hypothetical protein
MRPRATATGIEQEVSDHSDPGGRRLLTTTIPIPPANRRHEATTKLAGMARGRTALELTRLPRER